MTNLKRRLERVENRTGVGEVTWLDYILACQAWERYEAGEATEEEAQEACDVLERMAVDPKWVEFFESLKRPHPPGRPARGPGWAA